MRCICRHFARSDRSYLDSLCTVIGRGGEQLHSFLAFLLRAAGEGFGEGVDPQTGGAIAWDGKEQLRWEKEKKVVPLVEQSQEILAWLGDLFYQ